MKPGAILVELLGFAVLVLGNLVYNKIVRLPGQAKKPPRGN